MVRHLNSARAKNLALLLLFAISLSLIVVGCNDHDSIIPGVAPSGKLLARSECKFIYSGRVALSSSYPDCLELLYEGDSLLLYHINAAFNCCPEIETRVKMLGDTIVIEENETSGNCKCLCLYNLIYVVNNLPLREYRIRIIEEYLNESDSLLEFTVDLAALPIAPLCISRGHYPWNTSEGPYGGLVKHGECKEDSIPNKSVEAWAGDCVEYDYDGSSILKLKHTGAIFNCCPDSLGANLNIINDTIFIEEREYLQSGGCDCICPYDFEYKIQRLRPGSYIILVTGSHLPYGTQVIRFRADLFAKPRGIYCVGNNS